LTTAGNDEYVACIWQDSEQESKTKDLPPAGKTSLRSSTASPTKPKGPRKKVAGRRKPAAQKTSSSVTLTQMVGSSDTKHLQTVEDTENVCRFCFVLFFIFCL